MIEKHGGDKRTDTVCLSPPFFLEVGRVEKARGRSGASPSIKRYFAKKKNYFQKSIAIFREVVYNSLGGGYITVINNFYTPAK